MATEGLEFGILPYPKFDESQERYGAYVTSAHTLYSVPIDAQDPDLSGAVLELMASEGHRKIMPAYFDVTLKAKYSDGPVMSSVFDLLKDSIIFDVGYMFTEYIAPAAIVEVRNSFGQNRNWATVWAALGQTWENQVNSLSDRLKDLP